MFDSFWIALSGISADSMGVNVVGNDLANMNTTGFKASTLAFHDLVSQFMGSGTQIGAGTGTPLAVREFTQGSIQVTGGPLDAAVQGPGFFVVRNQSGQTLYTRAGSFHLDAAGNLLTSTGESVQGWTGASATTGTGALGNVVVPLGATSPPQATTQMSLNANLDANAAKDGTFSAPIQVVDSLGNTHVLTVTFTNTGSGSWSYAVSMPGSDLKGGTAGAPAAITGATGNLSFDADGKLQTPALAAGNVPIKVTGLADGAADLSISWSLYNTDGTARLTQFSQASGLSASTQDGLPAGQIAGVAISDGGAVVAQYSNGRQQTIGQLALAAIRNPESLIAVGNNNLALSPDTADPAVGAPDSGGRGHIVGSSLEESTVDMAREFANLIVMERSYQANARVITTTDELTQETVDLKR